MGAGGLSDSHVFTRQAIAYTVLSKLVDRTGWGRRFNGGWLVTNKTEMPSRRAELAFPEVWSQMISVAAYSITVG